MKILKKILAVASLCAVVLSMTACSSGNKSAAELNIDGKKVAVDKIGEINGTPMDPDLFFAFYAQNKGYFDPEALKEEAGAIELKELTYEVLSKLYAADILFEEYKLEYTDEDKKSIEDAIKSAEESAGGKEQFDASLAQSRLTRDSYKYLMENSLRQKKLLEVIKTENTDKAQIIEDVKKDYVRAYHILVKSSDKSSTDRELAESLLKRAKDGEDFLSLVKEFGEDPGMESKPEGYYFTYGAMVPEFEAAAFALEDGAISEIVETTHGFHIIKRYPMEDKYFEDNFDTVANDIMMKKLDEKMAAKAKELEFVPSDKYELITPETLV